MVKFFTNQKLDEAGIVGVSLQKLLIFFMLIDSAWLVLGVSFFGPFMSLVFHAVVLMGVYKRRTCVLLIYTVFNIIIFLLTALALLFVVGAMMTMDQGDISSSEHQYNSSGDVKDSSFRSVSSMVRRSLFSVSPSSTESSSTESSGSSTNTYSSESSEVDGQVIFLVAIVAVLFSLVVLYCKILSTMLAYRMRKLLLANNQGLPVYKAVPTDDATSDAAPEPESASFDSSYPAFPHPGFVPFQSSMQPGFYPNFQGAPHAMMPPPFMYGQHPVFYTFAPPTQSTNTNEKL